MLVLSRKEGEGITLTLPTGEKIQITVTEYRGSQTAIGIDAPKDVLILRNELNDQNNKLSQQQQY